MAVITSSLPETNDQYLIKSREEIKKEMLETSD